MACHVVQQLATGILEELVASVLVWCMGKQGIDTGIGAKKMTLYATFWEGRGQNISAERKQRKMLQGARDIKNVFLGATG
jgi:hypothetical protein